MSSEQGAVASIISQETERRYPISEIFTSVQGEGLYTGAAMTFVRFSGCSVGRPVVKLAGSMHYDPNEPAYREVCHSWDGRSFLCDTDFRRKMTRTTSELLSEIPKLPQRVCFTGGEPLNHNLKDLALSLVGRGQIIHVETSGTVVFPPWMAAMRSDNLWLTVSPKAPLLLEQLWFADEVKLLVDPQFNLEEADRIVAYVGDRTTIWIQPINTEWELDRSNLAQCLALLQQRPTWRLSSQMHKIWKVR